MKTLIALEIDEVLIPWDDDAYEAKIGSRTTYDRYGKATGFTDWRKVDEKFFTFVSDAQLAAIQAAGDIHWLTTWAQRDLHPNFERVLNIGPFPTLKPEQSYEGEFLYRWWKMGWLYLWVRENPDYIAQYDRIIWVDDEHGRTSTTEGLAEVAFELSQLGTELVVHRPEGNVLSLAEIESWSVT